MNIFIICASKIKKDSPIGLLIEDYKKRLTSIKLNIIDFDEKNLSTEKINEKIFSFIKADYYKILLDEKGESLTTLQLKNFLTTKIQQKNIAFLIAGSDGFIEKYKNLADYKLSLSNLTFPHKLARLILIEQLYRVQSLINNHPYHRE